MYRSGRARLGNRTARFIAGWPTLDIETVETAAPFPLRDAL
jgi:hypothetical protein